MESSHGAWEAFREWFPLIGSGSILSDVFVLLNLLWDTLNEADEATKS